MPWQELLGLIALTIVPLSIAAYAAGRDMMRRP